MRLALCVILGVSPLSCFADECSERLSSYQEGLAVMSVAAADAAARSKAVAEIRRIEKARRSMSDCKVIQTIPALVKTDRAIQAADRAERK